MPRSNSFLGSEPGVQYSPVAPDYHRIVCFALLAQLTRARKGGCYVFATNLKLATLFWGKVPRSGAGERMVGAPNAGASLAERDKDPAWSLELAHSNCDRWR
jgi:hypothetical protein